MILAPFHFAFDDALRVGVKVMPCFQVTRDEQDDPGIAVVGAGAIKRTPKEVARARTRRANVGVAVVPINAPALDDAICVAHLRLDAQRGT